MENPTRTIVKGLRSRNAQLFEENQQLKAELDNFHQLYIESEREIERLTNEVNRYYPAETNTECNGLLYMKKVR